MFESAVDQTTIDVTCYQSYIAVHFFPAHSIKMLRHGAETLSCTLDYKCKAALDLVGRVAQTKCVSSSEPVIKIKLIFVRYFGPTNILFDKINKWFSGRPDRYFGAKAFSGYEMDTS